MCKIYCPITMPIILHKFRDGFVKSMEGLWNLVLYAGGGVPENSISDIGDPIGCTKKGICEIISPVGVLAHHHTYPSLLDSVRFFIAPYQSLLYMGAIILTDVQCRQKCLFGCTWLIQSRLTELGARGHSVLVNKSIPIIFIYFCWSRIHLDTPCVTVNGNNNIFTTNAQLKYMPCWTIICFTMTDLSKLILLL